MSDLQERVQTVLDNLVESGTENGIQAAIYHHGDLVVDAFAGIAAPGAVHSGVTGSVRAGSGVVDSGGVGSDPAARSVSADTVFFTASAVKGVASTVVHVLVEGGVFGYDTLVADLWPEFGAHGKETATVRHVLTHSAGVPALPGSVTLEQLCDWDGMCSLIAGLEPWWKPGDRVGYHAVTFGFILGEVVRRATGKRISQVLAEGIGERLGVTDELYFGVPAAALDRVAHFEDDPVGAAMFASLPPDFPLFKAGPRDLFPNAAYANNPRITASDIPAGGVVSARAIARMYAALLGDVGPAAGSTSAGRLVSPERLQEITSLSTTGKDEMTGGPAQYGLGYTIGQIGQRAVAPTVFGMVGIGGGAAYADTATGLAVAVTKNRFNPVEMNAFDQIWNLATTTLA